MRYYCSKGFINSREVGCWSIILWVCRLSGFGNYGSFPFRERFRHRLRFCQYVINFLSQILCVLLRYFNQKLAILPCLGVLQLLNFCSAWVTSSVVTGVQSNSGVEFVILRDFSEVVHSPTMFLSRIPQLRLLVLHLSVL